METLLKIVMSVVELILSFKFCDCYLELKKKVVTVQNPFMVHAKICAK